MAKILVVENAPPLRQFLRLHLETAGHQVQIAEDVGSAERLSALQRPELILAGSGKAGIDAQRVLARLRANATTASVPTIMVSLRGDADAIRQAHQSGAVAFLLLPVTREALLQAVSAHVPAESARPVPSGQPLPLIAGDPAVGASAGGTADDFIQPRADFTATVAPGERARLMDTLLPGAAPARPDTDHGAGRAVPSLASQDARSGTVLCADIRNFSALAEMLSTEEVADVLSAYCVRACEPILQQGGWIVKLLGHGLLAMFEPRARAPGHAERALKSALFSCIVAQRFDEWLRRRFPQKALPEFAVGVGVHSGAVMVYRINIGGGVDTSIVGDTVNLASRLEEQTKALGASVLTTLETLALAGPRFVTGKHGALLGRGRAAPVEIAEITGLRPRPNVDARGLQTYSIIAEAVSHNTAIIQRERDGAPATPQRIRPGGEFSPP